MIETIFAGYGIIALLLFRFTVPWRAVAITCFAGWLILPIGNFPAGSASSDFPYWITGSAIPSDMLLTKMWWPPILALTGAAWADRDTLVKWKPGWADVPMLFWCLWPLGQWPFIENPEPQPIIAALYLSAAWGAPWVLGRIYFSGNHGASRLLSSMVAGMAFIVPVALLEGAYGPFFYGWFYEPHPFRFDGAQRYFGFRPIGFFEHGNQYGIWVAASALAAISLWQAQRESAMRGTLAALCFAIALISQSLGAILLLFAALVVWWSIGRSSTRWILLFFLLLTVFGSAIYLSGKLPLRRLAENTAIGREIVEVIRSSGRGSFTWRIARDEKALPLAVSHPLIGMARWNWWRENNERPWGLALLILGQFGLIGLVLAFGSLLVPALRALAFEWHARTIYSIAPLALIILMASADALLNAFFFYPAIVAAGALAVPRSIQGPLTCP